MPREANSNGLPMQAQVHNWGLPVGACPLRRLPFTPLLLKASMPDSSVTFISRSAWMRSSSCDKAGGWIHPHRWIIGLLVVAVSSL